MYTLEQPYRHLISSQIHFSQTVLTALLITTSNERRLRNECKVLHSGSLYSVNMQKYGFLDNLKLKKFCPTHFD